MENIGETLAKAKGGDAEAQFILGRCYWNGDGVAANMVEATKWWRKAANFT